MNNKLFYSLMTLVTLSFVFISCEKEDEYEEVYLNDETYQSKLVQVRADGSTAVFESGKISGCTSFEETASQQSFIIDGVLYEIKNGHAEVISGSGQSITIYKHVVYNKNFYVTTAIADQAFALNGALETITMPNSVESIGVSAFSNCASLAKIDIPNSVVSIGDQAFNKCYNLTNVTIGSGTKTIGAKAFFECRNLSNVQIEEGLESIGTYAFYGCEFLTEINLPNTLKRINDFAFLWLYLETSKQP